MTDKRKEFSKYREWNICRREFPVKIGTDESTRHQVIYAYYKGKDSTVTIGIWDRRTNSGWFDEGLIRIADEGLVVGENCKVMFLDKEGNEYYKNFYIRERRGDTKYLYVPILPENIEFSEGVLEECFVCQSLDGESGDWVFKVKDVDPI